MILKTCLITFTILASICAFAQNKPLVTKNINQVLNTIESSSPVLKALHEKSLADKSETTTGISMTNPTVGFNYLWGSNEPDRYDINVTQEMEFPTVYVNRRRLANGQANVADINYLIGRQQLFEEAASLCVQIAFATKKGEILSMIAASASEGAKAVETSFTNGHASSIELSKARIHALNAQNEVTLNDIDIQQMTEQLYSLCGATKPFTLDADDLPTAESLPADFESWYTNIDALCPEILLAQQNADNSALNVKLQKAQWAPNLALGYMSEHTSESSLNGVSLGISIPLYERRNSLRTARSQQAAASALAASTKLQVKAQLKATYLKAQALFNNASLVEETVSVNDTRQKAITALNNGEISISQYNDELEDYYALLLQLNDIKKEAALLAEQLLINQK